MRTIKSSVEITRLFKEGKRVSSPGLNIIALRNEGQHDRQGRVAFIAGKKLGNAVWRNRAKRRMREICRQLGGPFPGYDVAFVAKKDTTTCKFEHCVATTRKNLAKAGLIKYE